MLRFALFIAAFVAAPPASLAQDILRISQANTPVFTLGDMALKVRRLSRDGFGTVMIADFEIRNDNPFPVWDMVVACDNIAASGTVLETKSITIYQRIEPKTTRTFRRMNMGFMHEQSAHAACRLVDVSL